jgi:hypothetical protein
MSTQILTLVFLVLSVFTLSECEAGILDVINHALGLNLSGNTIGLNGFDLNLGISIPDKVRRPHE